MTTEAILKIVISYEGTKFFTRIGGESQTYKQHNSLEEANEYLVFEGYENFETVTEVRFTY